MHFCDYNRSVLVETTWPTIFLNLRRWKDTHISSDYSIRNNGSIRCFAGDWSDVSDWLSAESGTKYYWYSCIEWMFCVGSHMKIVNCKDWVAAIWPYFSGRSQLLRRDFTEGRPICLLFDSHLFQQCNFISVFSWFEWSGVTWRSMGLLSWPRSDTISALGLVAVAICFCRASSSSPLCRRVSRSWDSLRAQWGPLKTDLQMFGTFYVWFGHLIEWLTFY